MASRDWQMMHRLLVARLDNVGDVVMCGPALRAIRAVLPNASITLWASPGGSQAAALLPEIDDVLPTRVVWQDLGQMPQDPARERELVELIAAGHFDGVVIFTSFRQSPYPPAYVAYLAGISLRAGQSREFGGSLLTDWIEPLPDATHQVDRNVHLVEQIGFPPVGRDLRVRITPDARESLDTKLTNVGLPAEASFVLMHPGASCPSRVYPWGRYADAARRLNEETGLAIVVSGAAREADTAQQLCSAVPGATSLVGQTTLPELAALVGRATLLIANNTLVMHLADALNTPSVILFAGTELEAQWRPQKNGAVLLRRPTWCSPCYAFDCPYQHECLDVPAEEVVEAALRVLDGPHSNPETGREDHQLGRSVRAP